VEEIGGLDWLSFFSLRPASAGVVPARRSHTTLPLPPSQQNTNSWCVKYPPYMSPAARDLIARLLERKPAKRLGMLQGRASDIKAHKWFEGFDWQALAARRLEPPRVPKETDHAKRKAELAEQHRADPVVPVMTPEEVRECEQVFKDF